MHVYGELHGTLTTTGQLHGSLVGDHHKITGTLTIPNAPGLNQYAGPYEVTPRAYVDQVLETDGLLMTDDVTVFKVPYYETSNIFDGLTVFIAEDSNG